MEKCLVRRSYARKTTHEEEQQSGEKLNGFQINVVELGILTR
jgi:hypothetical protein